MAVHLPSAASALLARHHRHQYETERGPMNRIFSSTYLQKMAMISKQTVWLHLRERLLAP
jgi:hypothetical protein